MAGHAAIQRSELFTALILSGTATEFEAKFSIGIVVSYTLWSIFIVLVAFETMSLKLEMDSTCANNACFCRVCISVCLINAHQRLLYIAR